MKVRRRSHRNSNLVLTVAGAALALVLLGSSARADVAPIDACTSPGQPCGGDSRCTCKVEQCTRSVPCTDGGSGRCTMAYECNLCRRADDTSCPTEPGTGGAGAGGSGGAGKGGKDAGGSAHDEGGDSGCNCSTVSAGHASAVLPVLVALIGLRARRRRRA